MSKNPYKYTPLASYQALKRAEISIQNAVTIDDLRDAMVAHGAKIGYKAFCDLVFSDAVGNQVSFDRSCN